MALKLFEWGAKEQKPRPAVAQGTVIGNMDCLNQAKVLVRVPSLGQEVWARLVAPGAGAKAGFFFTPRMGDEVLVALGDGYLSDAYIVGGLWNTQDSPPVTSPTDALTKRVLRTGLTQAAGHEMEFDDALQSVTITTSTRQKVTVTPDKIELANTLGTLRITLDNLTQTVTVQGVNVEISAVAQLKLSAANITIDGKVMTDVKSTGLCAIKGSAVTINS